MRDVLRRRSARPQPTPDPTSAPEDRGLAAPTEPPDDAARSPLTRLDAALDAFARDDRATCQALLDLVPDGGGDLGRALRLLCEGLEADAAGDRHRARDRIQLADAIAPPVPPLLDAIGRFHHRTGDYDRAFRAYALLAAFDPTAWGRFRRGLPHVVAARYLPVLAGATRDEPGNPPHHDLGSARDALAARIGVDAGAVVASRLAVGPRRAAWRTRTSLHAELEDAGIDTRCLGGGEPYRLPEVLIHDAPSVPGLASVSRPIVRGILRDTTVASKSYLLLREDRAILDARPEELASVEVQLTADPAVVATDGDRLLVLEPRTVDQELPVAVSLIGERSTAFGHWMLEFLPRLLAVRDLVVRDRVPVLIDAQMPGSHRQSLRTLLGPDHPIVVVPPGGSVLVERLHAATQPLYMPLAPVPPGDGPPDLMAPHGPTVARLIREALPPDPADLTTKRRVYLSRGGRARRRLESADEVETWAAGHGFVVVDPSELTFDAQYRLMREADVVMGPDGSALYLTWFARPGTRIGILGNGQTADFHQFYEVAAALGQPVLMLQGELTRAHANFKEMSDYRIDAGRLDGFMEALGAL